MTVPVHEVNDQGSSLTQDEQRRKTSSPTRGYAEGSFSPRRSSVNDCSRNADKVASPSHAVQNEGVTSQQDEQRRRTSSPTRGYAEGSFSPRRSTGIENRVEYNRMGRSARVSLRSNLPSNQHTPINSIPMHSTGYRQQSYKQLTHTYKNRPIHSTSYRQQSP